MATVHFPLSSGSRPEPEAVSMSRTSPLRAIVFALGMILGMGAFAIGLSQFYRIGQAEAQRAAEVEPAHEHAPSVVLSADDAGADAAVAEPNTMTVSVTATSTGDLVAPGPAIVTVEQISTLTKLWRSGTFACFAIILVFVGLSAWGKLDKKRAFYAALGVASLAGLVEPASRGETPNAAMFVNAAMVAVSILIKGPGATLKA